MLFVAALGALAATAWPEPAIEVNLKAVGHDDLGGHGPWDDVAAIGTTAVVGAGMCPASSLTVVDVKAARHPRVVATVPLPEGLVDVGLDAEVLSTPAFTGDLLAVAVQPCSAGSAGGGVLYFDLGRPSRPRPLGRTEATGTGPVSIALRDDGRVLAAIVVAGQGAVQVDDVTDPSRPVPLTRWTRPDSGGPPRDDCRARAGGSAVLAGGGRRALVAFPDGGVYDLDLAEPARPVVLGHADAHPSQGRPGYAATLPVGRRTLAVVSEGNASEPGCAVGQQGRGLRVLAIDPPNPLTDAAEVRLPSPAAPGRLVASGELAYVAWHGDGLRVVDLGQVVPRTVAQFVPPSGDVVGVALLDEHVLVTDRSSGLYVLERLAEGRPESWLTQLKNAGVYLAFAGFMGAAITLPRLAMARAAARSRAGVGMPVPGRVRRT